MRHVHPFGAKEAGTGFSVFFVNADASERVAMANDERHAVRLFADMDVADSGEGGRVSDGAAWLVFMGMGASRGFAGHAR